MVALDAIVVVSSRGCEPFRAPSPRLCLCPGAQSQFRGLHMPRTSIGVPSNSSVPRYTLPAQGFALR